MNIQDKIYVMTDFVPERNKNILTACKVYQATKVDSKYSSSRYTIVVDDGNRQTIDIKCCAYLDGKPWCPMYGESYTYAGKKDTLSKEQAWKLLTFIERPFSKSRPDKIYLGGNYSKEELKAILLVWDELK